MSLPEILQDSQQKYANTTIAKMVGDGNHTAEPFHVSGVNEGRTQVAFSGQILHDRGSGWTPEEIIIRQSEDIDRSYCLTVPPLGVFNVKDTTVHLVRHPNRQWQRGYTERVVSLSSINKDEYGWLGRRLVGCHHPELLWEVFNPRYPGCDEAFQQVSSLDYMARAWNGSYHYVMKRTLPHVMVAHLTNIIGYRIDDVTYLSSSYVHLKEELGEFSKLEILDDAKQKAKDGGERVGPSPGDTTVQRGQGFRPAGGLHWDRDRTRGLSRSQREQLFEALAAGRGRQSPELRPGTTAHPPTLRRGPDAEFIGPLNMDRWITIDEEEEDIDSDF